MPWIPDRQINGIVKSDAGFIAQVNSPEWFLRVPQMMTYQKIYRRYEELDLDFYRRIMAPSDYGAFVNYIGAESVGIQEEDFEVYYPED